LSTPAPFPLKRAGQIHTAAAVSSEIVPGIAPIARAGNVRAETEFALASVPAVVAVNALPALAE